MTAPVLDNSASPSLPTILEGATDPAGITIADLVVDGSITDPDGPAIEAIAITGLNTSLGAWQYSLDGGSTWLTIQDQQLNTVANERALLLGPTAMLRLLPFGDSTGTLTDAVTFRAWDQSSGGEGQYVATSAGGGDTAFSAAVDTASVTVQPDESVPPPLETNQGEVLTDFSSGAYDFATSVTVQPDGKVVVAGSSQSNGAYGFAVVRYNCDGSLDTTFNGTGQALPHFGANDWAWTTTVQPDGRLLIGGTTGASSVLIRYNQDGSPDTSFAGTGQLVTDAVNFGESLALGSDGRFVVAGLAYTSSFDFALARYNSNGTADTSFNGTGGVVTDFSSGSDFARAVAVQVDGKIVALGQRDMGGTFNTFLELARYNPDGSLDTSFDGSGQLLTDVHATSFTGGGLAIQSDGKILVAGESYANGIFDTDFSLVRLNSDGSLDSSFGVGGTVATDMGADRQDMASRVIVQPDGKILVAGSTDVDGTWNFALVRYNPDGSLDTTFNGTGKVSTDIGNHSIDYAYGLSLQPDGKIVVAGTSDAHGSYDFAVVRYNADGSLDTTFGGSNLYQYVPGGAPILLSDQIAIYDTVLAHLNGGAGNYAGASMTLSRNGGADPQDVFSAVGELSFDGSSVVLSGVVVGTVTNGSGTLTIVFNSAATQERVNGVLSHIAYANSADAPPPEVVIDYGFGTSGATLGLSAASQPVVGSVNVEILGAHATATIDGLPLWGKTLTVHDTIGGAAVGPIQYQWFADGSPIPGADGASLPLIESQIGSAITVRASYTDVHGDSVSVMSTATPAVLRDGVLSGSSGVDTLVGGLGDDLIAGLDGNDALQGLAGNDTLIGAAGTDALDGGEGSDLYLVSSSAEHVAAEIVDTGTAGTDEVRFGATGAGSLTLFAGDTGIERVVIGTGTAAVANSAATTALSVNAGAVTNALWIVGNAGGNILTGTAFNDTLDGGAGADTLTGGNGNDTYIVDDAGDVVTESSGGGIDTVMASVNYTLGLNVETLTLTGGAAINGTGNALANVITGNAVANVIDGKGGVDTLDGGDGSDIYMIGVASDHPAAEIHDGGTTGIDEVRFAATKTSTLTLLAGDTGMEKVTIGTGTGATAVTSGTAALSVNASAVLNGLVILGNAGKNLLIGTAYDDTIIGGNSNDTLTGGAGADKFVFDTRPSTKANHDTITDFQSGTDVLQLSKAIFTAIGGAVGGLAIEQFWSGAGVVAAHDADDRIVYNTTTGILYYDADGNGGGAAVQIALLGTSTHPALAYTDILLIA
jgi:uncharacterized delta-60 repeat protein